MHRPLILVTGALIVLLLAIPLALYTFSRRLTTLRCLGRASPSPLHPACRAHQSLSTTPPTMNIWWCGKTRERCHRLQHLRAAGLRQWDAAG